MNEKLLGSIAEIRGRVGWKGYTVEDLTDFGPLVLGANEITSDNQLNLSTVKHLTREKYEESPEIFVKKDDILVVKVGSTIGKVAIVNKDLGEASINPNCVIVRATEINPYYLYYYLCSPAGKAFLINNSAASGQPAINQTTLKKMVIPVIDEAFQITISKFLNAINDKISNNTSICSDLESVAKLIYDYWFVQFDFPDVNGRPYKSSGGKMVWNEDLKREIPDGWEVKKLPEVCSLQYGYPLSTDKFGDIGIPIIRIRDIIDNSVSAFTTENVSSEYLTKSGDLLVGMDGNFQMNYWTRTGEIVNQRITRIRKSNLPIMLIKMQIEPVITAKITNVARSTVGHLGDADFKKQPIIVPNNLDLSIFEKSLETVISLRNESQQLASLRDFLLPMLMNGQVKVKS